tara:strand:+ start:419 stop:1117 length:699 start_codon:yes stop_codon:yes gene_type:complete
MLKLGIMQPYFFPYIQQFRHIGQCDKWIVFDTPKFSRKSWICRNRIINRNTGWSYISVPIVKNATQSPMRLAQIVDGNWQEKIFHNLKVYKHTSPYYNETIEIVEQCIDGSHDSIVDLNLNILKTICYYLDINTKIEQLSKLSLDLPNSAQPGEWACHISKAMGADVYSNAPGGSHLFDDEFYKKNNIILEFYQPKLLEYSTPGFEFLSDLSVIDSLMWTGIGNLKNWCSDS